MSATEPALVWASIVLIGVGTYFLRISAFIVFEYLENLPTRVEIALGLVPAAVIAALAFPAIIAPEGSPALMGNVKLVAGGAGAVVAWYTESIFATMVAGFVVLFAVGAVV